MTPYQGTYSVAALFAACALAGCSVGMALHGQPDRNVAALHIGQPREEVLVILGQPTQTFATDQGRQDVFDIERGNAPSAGRAIGHGVMDVLTLGAWEIIGTPIEGVLGDTISLTIGYDSTDRVQKITSGLPSGEF